MKPWILPTAFTLCACTSPSPPVADSYLKQPLPGTQPEVFARNLVSQPEAYEYGSVWSADGREFYFAVNVGDRAEIRCRLWAEGNWSQEQVVINHERHTFGDPFLSPDQERLYFISNRPLEDLEGPSKDFDIWFVERQTEGWGDAINLGAPVNSDSDEYYISFSDEGRIYFASNTAGGDQIRNFDLYCADPTDSGFSSLQRLEGEINTVQYEADAFVAPEESYMIYCSFRDEGLGEGDLYISFRRGDGSWSEGVNLGAPINTEGHELCPFVTADGRFFFYTSAKDIYWVDASVLETFRPSTLR